MSRFYTFMGNSNLHLLCTKSIACIDLFILNDLNSVKFPPSYYFQRSMASPPQTWLDPHLYTVQSFPSALSFQRVYKTEIDFRKFPFIGLHPVHITKWHIIHNCTLCRLFDLHTIVFVNTQLNGGQCIRCARRYRHREIFVYNSKYSMNRKMGHDYYAVIFYQSRGRSAPKDLGKPCDTYGTATKVAHKSFAAISHECTHCTL